LSKNLRPARRPAGRGARLTLAAGLVLAGLGAAAAPSPARATVAPASAGSPLDLPLHWAASSPALLPRQAGPPPLDLRRGHALDQTLAAVGLVGASFALDRAVGAGYPQRGPSLVFEEPGETFGGATLLLAGTAALAAGGIALHKPALVRTAKESALALGATTAVVLLAKLATQRQRPDGSNRYSFPSGHTAGAFAVATVLDREAGRGLGRFAYLAAATAGYARIAGNKHYFSDVVTGMLVGHLVGRLVTRHRHAAVASPAAPLPEAPAH